MNGSENQYLRVEHSARNKCSMFIFLCVYLQPSVGADLDEIIILPGSALAAWQLSVLAYKLSNKGSKRLRTIRLLSRSSIYIRYNKVDEAELTIEAANVDCLSAENNISIDVINRLTQYMNITKLRFKVGYNNDKE